ncbi:MAG: PleD family two-component system response regulator [Steroidobacteraceae bacterium]
MRPATASAVPRRALVIDPDATTRETTSTLLGEQGFTVVTAGDGAEALTVFARDWYPLVFAGRDTPTLDGFEVASRLRAIALAPVYVILMTSNTDAREHERGYCAGVDQYLLMQNFPSEVVAKAEAGMVALRRRRSARTGGGDEPATVDLENGAHTARHLIGRLHAEIAHAARTGELLQILSIGIDTDDDLAFARRNVNASVSGTLLAAVHDSIRPKRDWVARLPAPAYACRLAVVMPESTQAGAAAVEQAVRNAFVHWNMDSASGDSRLSFGLASFADGDAPTALAVLSTAERNRRTRETTPPADSAGPHAQTG